MAIHGLRHSRLQPNTVLTCSAHTHAGLGSVTIMNFTNTSTSVIPPRPGSLSAPVARSRTPFPFRHVWYGAHVKHTRINTHMFLSTCCLNNALATGALAGSMARRFRWRQPWRSVRRSLSDKSKAPFVGLSVRPLWVSSKALSAPLPDALCQRVAVIAFGTIKGFLV